MQKAQEQNRRLGIPNAYSTDDGRIYYELPNGDITFEDPFPPGDSDATR